jgi:hypothetical protein
MTFWIIAAPALVAVGWLVWWSSGRAKPDLRRRSIESEIAMREGSAGSFDIRDGGGPHPGGSGF